MFSLLNEPCLRAQAHHGPVEEHSVRSALLNAHTLGDLVVGLPTQHPSKLRQLLLPVVVDALGRPANEREWAVWFRRGRWTPEQERKLTAYFEEYADRFDLLHPKHPFAQVADLHTAKNETKGAGLLVASGANGNNVPLFASHTEGDVLALTLPQALTWLLHTHCWDTAAIKTGAVGDPRVKSGKTTGNPTGPLGQMGVTLPLGRTLYETLLLNIPVGPPLRSDDLPQWRRRDGDHITKEQRVSASTWYERMPVGILDLWTWQSRRIRLVPEETGEGLRITRVVVAAGDRMPHTPEFDPHTMWRMQPTASRDVSRAKKPKGGASARRPLRMQPGKAAWRDMQALLALSRQSREASADRAGFATSWTLDQAGSVRADLGEGYPLRVELCGITYGVQSAVIEDVMSDSLPLPLAALDENSFVRDAVLEVAAQTEELAEAVNHLSADLHRAAGGKPIPWDKGHRPGEQVLHTLDPLIRRLLAGIRGTGEDDEALEKAEAGQLAWEQLAWRATWGVADRLIQAVPVSAFAGRTESREGRPDLFHQASLAERRFLDRRKEILHRVAKARAQSGQDRTQDTITNGDDGA
ncbi:type I-E CRISPR-associated protein Cse1/CasA [Streptomyces sp. NPDC050560]|uniref:type I-E CRISPR-associated protein Cse1/CasA n=1 Tax=Streptomyces sp. NPDC050560 TaxID=3365630 RepID=UPI0037AB1F6E